MVAAFDEMKGTDGAVRPAYGELSRWLGEVPPDVLDYRRREAELLFRRIGITFAVYGEADATERLIPFDVIPRIISAAEWRLVEKGLDPARQGAQSVHQGRLWRARNSARRRGARRSGVPQSGLPPGDERAERAARHLHAHRRHRHHPRRCRHLLRAGGQCAHALRRLLHAGEPRDHDAAVSGTVLAPPHRAGGELSGRTAGDAEIGGARQRHTRSDRRAAHPRRVQLGLLRALLPRRQARHRAGRGPRPVRQRRNRLHAHHARAAPRRRDLPPHRRRLPRSAHLPARFGARRARADVRLSGRQRDARQRRRHRHRRRQGDLQLHAGDHEILSRRGADPEKRADLALPRGGASRLRARPSARAGGQGGARLRRLRHADRAGGKQDRHRAVSRQAQGRAEEFHRPADAGARPPARLASRRASRRATSICAPSCSPAATACASCRAA